jgi:hypothetical protein
MTNVDCTGMFEEFPDRTYKGNGYCTNTDREGDKSFARWSASSDMAEGRYEIIGGTGKFEGTKGGRHGHRDRTLPRTAGPARRSVEGLGGVPEPAQVAAMADAAALQF